MKTFTTVDRQPSRLTYKQRLGISAERTFQVKDAEGNIIISVLAQKGSQIFDVLTTDSYTIEETTSGPRVFQEV